MSAVDRIADVFSDCQSSVINHKSLTKRLRKIEAKHENNRSTFEERVTECVIRSLEVSKSERSGLNIVKFLINYCSETQNGEEDESEHTNITNQIMITLLPYMGAKDKIIRYRATQIVSQLMGIVQEIEDDLYQAIRFALGRRVRDKVPAIRLEAVCALGRLLENELDEEAQAAQGKKKVKNDDEYEDEDMLDDDDEEEEEGESESAGLLDKLLDVLQNDTNSDVRRALLLNLPVEPKTLPYLLERARDKDAAVRRSLYVKLMPTLGDFRHLSLSMREKLLRWGLRDRDERVRKAAAKMFSTLWIEQIAKTNARTDADSEEAQPKKKQIGYYEADLEALRELLERIDIMNAGQDDGVGLEAMREFWQLRPEYVDIITFDEEFWSTLTAETAFMARSFYDYSARNRDIQAKAEEKQVFPEVTRFGFHLQRVLNQVLEAHGSSSDIAEEDLAEKEFVAEQLLHIAQTLDYTDEIGRRKMFGLFRQMLSLPDLPEEITKLTIEALRLTCTADLAGEKEFIAVVQEAIADVNDTLNDDAELESENNRETTPADDESFVSAQSELSAHSDRTARQAPTKRDKKLALMTPDEREDFEVKEIIVQCKCLAIAHTMLQNVASDFSTNVSLDTMLNTLIIPAVRSQDALLREKAIECLGLMCLLSPALSRDNREMFVFCLQKGDAPLQMTCLRILCDCMVTHNGGDVDLSPFVDAFAYEPEVQVCATTCIAKLMMCGCYKPKLEEKNDETTLEEDGAAVFENAMEDAMTSSVKGADLLSKVKAAIIADLKGKEALDDGNRRQS